MNVRMNDGPVSCSKCQAKVATTYKIQGQSAGICAGCLDDHAMMQGPDRTVTIDGLNKGSAAAADSDDDD